MGISCLHIPTGALGFLLVDLTIFLLNHILSLHYQPVFVCLTPFLTHLLPSLIPLPNHHLYLYFAGLKEVFFQASQDLDSGEDVSLLFNFDSPCAVVLIN